VPVRVDKLNNIWAKFVWLGRSETESTYANPLSYLDGNFAIYTPNYKFDKRYKNRKITRYDGKLHVFKKIYGALPLGLVPEAVKLLKASSFEVEVSDDIKTSFLEDNINYDEIDSFIDNFAKLNGFNPYDFQINGFKLAIKKKRLLFESPTGSGKSVLIYLLIRYLMHLNKDKDFKVLLLVPNVALVTQMYRDFKSYKWNNIDKYVGLYDSEFTASEKVDALTKPVMIAVYNSIDGLLSKDKEFCNRFNMVMLDEAHRAKKDGKTLLGVLNSCINAEYRLGFTGTIPEEPLYVKTLEGAFGKKIILAETKDLQDRGILAKANIVEVMLPYDLKSIKFMKQNDIKFDEEVELLRLNKSKLWTISNLINSGKITPKQNTLILCSKIENGELDDIVKHINKYHPQFTTEIIYGGIKKTKRDAIITSMNNREGVILVATYTTMSTGINIKKLHNCIFASSLRSYETIVQSIGRILRLHETKDFATIYDLVDDLSILKRTGNMWRSRVNLQYIARHGYYLKKKFNIETLTLNHTFSIINTLNELSKGQ